MIVTFYSYKGGVGRSMALANVARWFQLCGLNVRAVDWDLEAPGLETFLFERPADVEHSREQLGLLDLLNQYRQLYGNIMLEPDADALEQLRRQLPPIQHSLVKVDPPSDWQGATTPGRLELLGAGWRAGDRFADYANAVQRFDWNAFYASYRGIDYFAWLREQLLENADVVLIDSRTGVTEMGGVCTRQMADVIVAFVAPNEQNVGGTRRIAESLVLTETLRKERRGRDLHLLTVPTRVDMSSDIKDRFQSDFLPLARQYWPRSLEHPRLTPWDLRIPYITRYAYKETLAIGARDGDSDLQDAYKRIAAHIAWLAPTSSRLCTRMSDEFDRVFGTEFAVVRVGAEQLMADTLSALDAEERELALGLLARMVVVADDPASRPAPRQIAFEDLDSPHRRAAERLLDARLLRRLEGRRTLIGLARDDLVLTPTFSEYLDRERPFLLWRQRLSTALEAWLQSGRDAGALLPASLVGEAERQRSTQPGHLLLDAEREFISLSARQAEHLQEQAKQAEKVKSVQAELEAAKLSARQSSRRLALAGVFMGLVALGGLIWYLSYVPIAAVVQNLYSTDSTKIDAAMTDVAVRSDELNPAERDRVARRFRELIKHPDPTVRWSAWLWMKYFDRTPGTVGDAVAAFTDPEASVRQFAVKHLGELETPPVEQASAVATLLDDPDADVRSAAIDTLASFGEAAMRPYLERIRRLETDSNESVRKAAAKALESIKLPQGTPASAAAR